MNKSQRIGVFLFFLTIFCDLGSKYIVEKTGGYIVKNTGISFNFYSGSNDKILSLLLCGLIVVLWCSFHTFFRKHPIGASFFLGGAVANVIDRLIFGGVRDWLPIPVISGYNNVADWALSIGLLLMLVPKASVNQDAK